ncbi:MAG: polysaccharide biosynthesis protein [Holosporaceae bacterium]|jgi:hypothetical protein|nr:polysaccharide biosynthesis protein [Holosporaceae bacterium]
MLKPWLRKIVEKFLIRKIKKDIVEFFQKYAKKTRDFPKEYVSHARNIFILIASYAISSFFIYPEFKFYIFLKEIFCLLCCYGAIFFWFVEEIDHEAPLKVVIGTTACVAPVFFIHASFGVALVGLFVMIVCEFIIFKRLRGCDLFSSLIPVYIICENESEADQMKIFSKDYKILESAVLSSLKNNRRDALKSVEDVRSRLQKINRISFFPSPKRLIYFSAKPDVDNLKKLLRLSADCSIPLFKASVNMFDDKPTLSLSSVSLSDLESVDIPSSDQAALATTFKGKRVWICYDGRGSVLGLAGALSAATSIDLTVFCESERLAIRAERELALRSPNKNYKVKIADINLLKLQGTKPDVFFYNTPIKFSCSGEENLKETLAKNALETKRIITFAQLNKIPYVFILSGSAASNAANWTGATQRLGELYAQFADSQSKKTKARFKIIRLPEETTDPAGIFGQVVESISAKGYANVDLADSERAIAYYEKDILPPLVKTILFLMKNSDTTSSVYAVAPKCKTTFEDFIKDARSAMGLREEDARIVYNYQLEAADLETTFELSESLEKTAIDGVFRSKFLCSDPDSYERIWTIEEINEMTTRELISAVFQSLKEKLKTQV